MKRAATLAALTLVPLTACGGGARDDAGSTASGAASQSAKISATSPTGTTTSVQASTTSSPVATSTASAGSSATSSISPNTQAPSPSQPTTSDALVTDGSDKLLSASEKARARSFTLKVNSAMPGAFPGVAYNRVYGYGSALCTYFDMMTPAEVRSSVPNVAPNLTPTQQASFYKLSVSNLCPQHAG